MILGVGFVSFLLTSAMINAESLFFTERRHSPTKLI